MRVSVVDEWDQEYELCQFQVEDVIERFEVPAFIHLQVAHDDDFAAFAK